MSLCFEGSRASKERSQERKKERKKRANFKKTRETFLGRRRSPINDRVQARSEFENRIGRISKRSSMNRAGSTLLISESLIPAGITSFFSLRCFLPSKMGPLQPEIDARFQGHPRSPDILPPRRCCHDISRVQAKCWGTALLRSQGPYSPNAFTQCVELC